ncbi:hypothetical protein B14911_25835 [Bacillus sp. NRRL B-14911]|nr:hypothetical protein B14911_25835 [Bacillus sp. NRRL B-14911]
MSVIELSETAQGIHKIIFKKEAKGTSSIGKVLCHIPFQRSVSSQN